MLPLHWVDQILSREHCPSNLLFDCWNKMVPDRIALQSLVLSLRFTVLLESRIADLVAVLKCSIVLASFLNRVVSQVCKHIVRVVRVYRVRLT